MDKPACKYGSDCYRKNPVHLSQYWHPAKRKATEPTSADSVPEKKPRLESPKAASKENLLVETSDVTPSTSSKPKSDSTLTEKVTYNLFLNKIFKANGTHKDSLAIVFPSLFMGSHERLVESAQLNFMVDLTYVCEVYRACKCGDKPLLVMYGQLGGSVPKNSNITCRQVQMPYQYGVHHSKVMIMKYVDGLRIVIHTANLIQDDWDEKTQGFWVSPLFPRLENGKASLLDGDSPTSFKIDFVGYLLSYKTPDLTRWSHIVREHDFSSCKVFFVGSVPGYHTSESKLKYGHTKVRSLLKKHSLWKPQISCPVIVQCSSIGSLGKDSRSWLTGELGVSLSGGSESSTSAVKVIYPSEDDVRESYQGYGGGSCLPYNSNTHEKQNWLTSHLHSWRSEIRHRTRAMPHIKTYTRIRNHSNLQYFLLTSANLSKAAWGQLQKQESQLFIRSYEAGVLFLPKFMENGSDSFELGGDSGFPLHYDIPLTPYKSGQTPWLLNTPKSKPDVDGRTYP